MSFNLRLNDSGSDSDDDVFKNASSFQAEGPRIVAFQGPTLDFAAVPPPTETKKPSGGLLGLLGIQVGNNEEIDKKWKERQTHIQIKDSVRRLQALDLDLGGGGSDDDDDDYDDRRLDADMDGSYDITDNGTLKISNFSVRRNNKRANSLIENISQDDLIEIGNLGAGAGGNVVKCLHKPTGVIVALKSIDVTDKGKRDQLVRELRELEVGDSSYLVGMHNLFYSDGQIHIALEYMDRGSLQSVVEKAGKLHEHVLADIARQMMLGLMHMHSLRKIHRDIKPGNVLVNQHGEVKISDFGIMAQLDTGKDNCNTFVGTTVYMSPERIDSLSYSYPGDIWSAGLTLMFCATGSLPISTHGGYWAIFQRLKNEPSPELGPEYSEDLRDFVAKCLIKDPAQRWDAISLLMHPFIQNKSLGPRRTIPYWPSVLQMLAKEDVRGNSNMNGTIKNLSQARDHIRQMQQQQQTQPYQYQYAAPQQPLSHAMAGLSLHSHADVDYEKTQLAPPQQLRAQMHEQAHRYAEQTYLPPSNYQQQQPQQPQQYVPPQHQHQHYNYQTAQQHLSGGPPTSVAPYTQAARAPMDHGADEYLVTQVSGDNIHARASVSAPKHAPAPSALAPSSSTARLSVSSAKSVPTTTTTTAATTSSATAAPATGSSSFLLKCRTGRQSTASAATSAAPAAEVKRTTTATASSSAVDARRRVSEAPRPSSGYGRADPHPTMTRGDAASSSSSLLRARTSSTATTATTATTTTTAKPVKTTTTTTTASRPSTARTTITTSSTSTASAAAPARKSTSASSGPAAPSAAHLGGQDDPFASAFAIAGSPLKFKRPSTASSNAK